MNVEIYEDDNGNEPFVKWLESLRDNRTQARIRRRIRSIEAHDHFGDHQPVGEGVYELRFHFGAGYRVYFGREGIEVVLLLTGGDKDSQERDIRTAKSYWKAYKSRRANP